jgi:hypothetical protein
MNVYLIVERDETDKVSEIRVSQNRLVEHIREALEQGTAILAIIRL